MHICVLQSAIPILTQMMIVTSPSERKNHN
jgi:hypothetical protein